MSRMGRHDRRLASGTSSVDGENGVIATSCGSSPATNLSSSAAEKELVEVTLEIEDDDTIVLRSVEPATRIDPQFETGSTVTVSIGSDFGASGMETLLSISRSSTTRRSSSSLLRLFSMEVKAEAVARAMQFSQELRKFSWGHGQASRILSRSSQSTPHNGRGSGAELKIAARARRGHQAQLNRTISGAQKALRGLRFISGKSNGVDAWNEVEKNFEKLSNDGSLFRSDFAQCIGMKDSKEFALELFDALSRRRRLKVDKISARELHEYWSQINDQSFDSRLQIFFHMYSLSPLCSSPFQFSNYL